MGDRSTSEQRLCVWACARARARCGACGAANEPALQLSSCLHLLFGPCWPCFFCLRAIDSRVGCRYTQIRLRGSSPTHTSPVSNEKPTPAQPPAQGDVAMKRAEQGEAERAETQEERDTDKRTTQQSHMKGTEPVFSQVQAVVEEAKIRGLRREPPTPSQPSRTMYPPLRAAVATEREVQSDRERERQPVAIAADDAAEVNNRSDSGEERSGRGNERGREGDERGREGDDDSGEEKDDSFSSAETNSTVWQDYIDNDAATRLQALSRGVAVRRELVTVLER